MSNTVFWIADRYSFLDEAVESATSVREAMPEVKRVLFTPTPDLVKRKHILDAVVELPHLDQGVWFLKVTQYLQIALSYLRKRKKLIYLDTDTFMCEPVPELFDMIGRFDLIGTHAPGRQTRQPMNEIPYSFPELNIGVIGINNTIEMRRFFHGMYKRYAENAVRYGNNDQPVLRDHLWENEWVRVGVFTTEYNNRYNFGGWAKGKVKILHGRTKHVNGRCICDALNKKGGFRGWNPGDKLW